MRNGYMNGAVYIDGDQVSLNAELRAFFQAVAGESFGSFAIDLDASLKISTGRVPAHEPIAFDAAEWERLKSGDPIAPAIRRIRIAAVKAERQRRIRLVADADKQAYYSRVMIALLERGKDTWTADEIALVDAIRAGNARIDAIVEAAAAIEAMDPIPADFAADTYWP